MRDSAEGDEHGQTDSQLTAAGRPAMRMSKLLAVCPATESSLAENEVSASAPLSSSSREGRLGHEVSALYDVLSTVGANTNARILLTTLIRPVVAVGVGSR